MTSHKKSLIDVKTKEELNIYMYQNIGYDMVTFGSKWGLRSSSIRWISQPGKKLYFLINYGKNLKTISEELITDEEVFNFIVKVRREESLNNILD